ncbi:MAG TPA: tetraacyldisaccharide 4'-kinase [Desulfofustis sp.]|nr:tetraacyldisaccharide 4'-kinase [Desulfofustis sp.]
MISHSVKARRWLESHKRGLFVIGRPFSPFYSALMMLRARLYSYGAMPVHQLPVPVISVGNLIMGGSGKTPLVIHLSGLLADNGYAPAVVSRGYGGTARSEVNIVSDGTTRLLSTAEAGDEPALIAHHKKTIVVATGRRRIHPCRAVIERYGCDVIVLDDGFQHISVGRDINLVLFDTDFFAGNSRVFPGGDLREPVSALNRADAFVLTGLHEQNRDRSEKCKTLLHKRFPNTALFTLSTGFDELYRYTQKDGEMVVEQVPSDSLPDDLVGFCGIAQPLRFKEMLARSGVIVRKYIVFADHHRYQDSDLAMLWEEAANHRGANFITTEKDMVKLADRNLGTAQFFVPRLKIGSSHALDDYILRTIAVRTGK